MADSTFLSKKNGRVQKTNILSDAELGHGQTARGVWRDRQFELHCLFFFEIDQAF